MCLKQSCDSNMNILFKKQTLYKFNIFFPIAVVSPL